MSILDEPDQWDQIDPDGMRHLLEALPNHLEEASALADELRLPSFPNLDRIVITGLGGSAIGADVVRMALSAEMTCPFTVNRNYGLPRWVGRSTAVIACSYSGNTEETLSAYGEARQAGAAIVCITSGGKLADRADADGVPTLRIPGGLPPRAAIGYSTVSVWRVLEALGLAVLPPESLSETVELLRDMARRFAPAVLEESNRAKFLAGSMHGKIVAVYASGILEAAALRWRGQMAENAKNLAFHHVLPEMNHNELVGWECPREALKQVAVVFLRDKGDHPQVARRFDLTHEIVQSGAGVVHEVWSEGDSPLSRIFSVIHLGDFVSLYLAYLNQVDPTPVRVIETLKQKLGS